MAAEGSSSLAVPLARSIFGTDPLDEFVCFIGGWIYATARGGQALEQALRSGNSEGEIEIEAKIGTLIDTRTGMRVSLPVANETILTDTQGIRFESNMSADQHRHYNGILNELCRPDTSRPKVSYKRHQEIDFFYNNSSYGGGGGGRGEKIRVTREEATMRTKERGSVVKKRLANLEVFCPNRAFDYRISVNLELQVPEPSPDVTHDFYREKNRVSYTHPGMQIDLTQVKVPQSGPGDSTLLHELEVELLPTLPISTPSSSSHSPHFPFTLLSSHSSSLSSQPASNFNGSSAGNLNGAAGGQDWTEYEDAIARLVSNVRLLIRNAPGAP